MSKSLRAEFRPQIACFSIEDELLPIIENVGQELTGAARIAQDGCWGYFPDFESDERLEASEAFADACSIVNYKGEQFNFSWVRLSIGSALGQRISNYHLDANGGHGLGVSELDETLMPTNKIWRLLINLHQTAPRYVGYLDTDISDINKQLTGGNIKIADGAIITGERKILIIPPRQIQKVSAGLICVSRVFHTGVETEDGHFLASWSREE